MRIKDPATGIRPDVLGRISGIEHVTYGQGNNFTDASAAIQAGSTYGYDVAGAVFTTTRRSCPPREEKVSARIAGQHVAVPRAARIVILEHLAA